MASLKNETFNTIQRKRNQIILSSTKILNLLSQAYMAWTGCFLQSFKLTQVILNVCIDFALSVCLQCLSNVFLHFSQDGTGRRSRQLRVS